MFFRNLSLYRFSPTWAKVMREADLDHYLARLPLKPLGPLETSSRGFVSPFGQGSQALTHRVGDNVLFALGGEEKILPGAVVHHALNEKVAAIAEREGRRPSGRERRRLRDEVLHELLPRAFTRPRRTNAYLDLARGYLVVDTASRKAADAVAYALREALGSFPALPLSCESSPRALMTAWLIGEHSRAGMDMPQGLDLGSECELRDPSDTVSCWRGARIDLSGDDVREHLMAGMQAFRLGLTYDDRLSFVLGQDLVIRKLDFLDIVSQEIEARGDLDERDELDATFDLMSREVGGLLTYLEPVLEFSKVEG